LSIREDESTPHHAFHHVPFFDSKSGVNGVYGRLYSVPARRFQEFDQTTPVKLKAGFVGGQNVNGHKVRHPLWCEFQAGLSGQQDAGFDVRDYHVFSATKRIE
jgi:hypothetical protein